MFQIHCHVLGIDKVAFLNLQLFFPLGARTNRNRVSWNQGGVSTLWLIFITCPQAVLAGIVIERLDLGQQFFTIISPCNKQAEVLVLHSKLALIPYNILHR